MQLHFTTKSGVFAIVFVNFCLGDNFFVYAQNKIDSKITKIYGICYVKKLCISCKCAKIFKRDFSKLSRPTFFITKGVL